jgi:hypothetical protein
MRARCGSLSPRRTHRAARHDPSSPQTSPRKPLSRAMERAEALDYASAQEMLFSEASVPHAGPKSPGAIAFTVRSSVTNRSTVGLAAADVSSKRFHETDVARNSSQTKSISQTRRCSQSAGTYLRCWPGFVAPHAWRWRPGPCTHACAGSGLGTRIVPIWGHACKGIQLQVAMAPGNLIHD